MRLVNSGMLSNLQKDPSKVRNICIMAHVDHGKTTLADCLVASNGIISQRLAGKLRYMDSRKDEQERGITMKSSSIALYYSVKEQEYLINLIDSPGHVDFSSEVSTAVRLCDGAVIVVDVVEGVCAQTIVAIRQAWKENLKPVLILNKIDRLILEVKLTPLDAYIQLTQVLEKVNAVMAELLTTEVMGREVKETKISGNVPDVDSASKEIGPTDVYDWSSGLDDIDDSTLYFSPDQGNVVFASAADGWGFRIEEFAKIYSSKLGVKESILQKTLWGDFYLNNKAKRIMKGAQEKAKKTIFVQLVLENLWTIYDTIVVRKDKILTEKLIASLNLQIHPRDLRQNDPKLILNSVMSKWLPLSTAVLEMVCTILPSPLELTEAKVERLLFTKSKNFSSLSEETQLLKQAFLECKSSDDAPVILFVSKMFAVERNSLPENRPKTLTHEEILARREQARQRLADRLVENEKQSDLQGSESATIEIGKSDSESNANDAGEEVQADAFIAFARVFSGTVRKGQTLYVLGPKHDPCSALDMFPNGQGIDAATTLKDLKPGQHVTKVTLKTLYLLMGRELEALEEVPAGNIIGIGDLDEHILKTATISSTLACPPFIDLNLAAVPILRVALEPVHTCDMEKTVRGLKLLNQADPCVQILVQETGEHVLITAGEVHLQRCLDDLRERFAKVELSVSKPIVPFRETIVEPPKMDMVNQVIETQASSVSKDSGDARVSNTGVITQSTANKKSTIKVRAVPLPLSVTKILERSVDILKAITDNDNLVRRSDKTKTVSLSESMLTEIKELRKSLASEFKNEGWDPKIVDQIWSFGPKKCGPNILINEVANHQRGCVWPKESETVTSQTFGRTMEADENPLYNFDSNFVNGFQLATLAGPLCEEPMMGVAFIVEDWSLEPDEDIGEINQPFGPFSGQIMSTLKVACLKAFQAQPQRLMVAMYSCSIQVNSEVLGKLYAVLGRRGGRILHGDLQEGSTNFEVTALLPVIESFDFANEVRRQTSGLALPQLVFDDWEVLEIDPFWQPTTEEEYLHFGEKADSENRARKYMNAVRKRKGLRVEEKIVEFAEKQRTLTRNK